MPTKTHKRVSGRTARPFQPSATELFPREICRRMAQALRPFYRCLRQTFDFLSVTAGTLHQPNIADNDGQEVVEIVCDAPG